MSLLPPGARPTVLDLPSGPLAAHVQEPSGTARATVLLVPGFTGSKEDFRLLLPPLAEAGLRAVAVDQRGQYESPGPDDDAAYAVEALGAHLVEAARSLEAPVHLVGHSFGGLVSRAAVLQDPKAFASLVLMSSGPGALGGTRADMMQFLRPLVEQGGLPAVRAAVEAVEAEDPRAQAFSQDFRDFLRARFLASSQTGLLAMGDALLGEPDRVADLAAAGVRTLVLHGADDDAWTPASQADMAVRLGAEHVVVAGAAHSPAVENAPDTLAALLVFWG
ncbi:MAG: alpha/beta hydrolase fold protein [Frankiales bacterium]|nr:alpha/beta hydrolase fold protein [Frankiales bacterium]